MTGPAPVRAAQHVRRASQSLRYQVGLDRGEGRDGKTPGADSAGGQRGGEALRLGYFFMRRRTAPARPNRPVPSSSMEPGSGTLVTSPCVLPS